MTRTSKQRALLGAPLLWLALATPACEEAWDYKKQGSGGGASLEGGAAGRGAGGATRGGAAIAEGGAVLAGGSAGAVSEGGTLGAEAGSSSAGEAGSLAASGGSASGGASSVSGGAASGGTASGGAASGGKAPCIQGGTSSAGSAAEAGAAGANEPVDFSKLVLTPPMGWNSWNRFGGNVSEALIKETADALVASGMRDAGYTYVNIDDTWQKSRDACGNIVPDAARFPSGIKALADYVHARGLKLGLYSDRGTLTCAGRPGSYGYEVQDAQTYAAWGVDYLKYDNCYAAPGRDNDTAMRQDYTVMRDALRATGRPIVYSICAWWFQPWMPSVGHLWRTTTDIEDNFDSNIHGVISLVNKNGEDASRFGYFDATRSDSAAYLPGLAQYAGPGHWNDPDMLEVGNGGMTDIEYRTHFSMWAMMAAPLIAGNDVARMSDATRQILLNDEIIAVDQDPLGKQGRPISASKTLEVWSKPLSGSSSYAVALFNRTAAAADISVSWSELGITGSATVRDLWAHANLGSIVSGYTATNVPSHGVVILKVVGQ
ncbi:MAG: glycoside hydrolase family 27 protein [Polyangiaceae bacterium]